MAHLVAELTREPSRLPLDTPADRRRRPRKVQDIVERYGCSPETARRWLRSGRVKGSKNPGGRVWDVHDIEK